jgi:uncharacterized membrane protein YdbT with pleckstrin-like domain
MNDFQAVKRASLYYRFLPRLILLLFIAVVIAIVLTGLLGFLKLFNFLMISLTLEIIAFIILSLAIYISARLEYSNLKYLIEEDALFLKEGVLKVDTETIPFQKIRNASFLQSLLQRMFRVGDLVIDQEPESYTWGGIDLETARTILDAVALKSNIQPISVSANNPIPLQHNLDQH